MSIITQDDQIAITRAKAETKLLLNTDLKNILREQGLPISGVKALLQARVQDRLQELFDQGEAEAFRKLCRRIKPAATPATASSTSNGRMAPNYADLYAGYKIGNGYYGASSAYPSAYSNASYPRPNGGISQIRFPNTPFHEILEPMTRNQDLPIVHQNRHHVTTTFALGAEKQAQMRNEDPFRILIYCTSDLDSPKPDVGFPNQIEIRVNDESFLGNLRGIKKKAGTTRPADITHLVRKLPNYTNRVAVTYAATDKKYFMVVNYVRKHSVTELVSKIKQGNVITKDQVINEMISKANDADIVATSSVMSLKCPLSAMRMSLPCRSTICNHNQCFDAESFLQLQEQAPQWSCPTCNKVFPFEALAVDQYVQDILKRFPQSVDQVTIEPNGAVKHGSKVENMSAGGSTAPAQSKASDYENSRQDVEADDDEDDDDDDVIEIRGGRPQPVKNEPTSATTPWSFQPTSHSQSTSRLPSTPASTTPSTNSSKRKQTEVVDLTLSSDEDEGERPRQPPIKRSSTSGGISSSFSSTLPTLASSSTTQQQTSQPWRQPSSTSFMNDFSSYNLPPARTFQFSPLGFSASSPSNQAPTMQTPSWNQSPSSPYAAYTSFNPWGGQQ